MEERGYDAAALMTSGKHTSFPATEVVSLQFTQKGMFWKKEGVNGQSHSVERKGSGDALCFASVDFLYVPASFFYGARSPLLRVCAVRSGHSHLMYTTCTMQETW